MNLGDCQDVVELVTDYLEDALSPADRTAFDAHLAECTGCHRYLEQVRTTVDLLGRSAGAPALPAGTVDALVAAFGELARRPPSQRRPSPG